MPDEIPAKAKQDKVEKTAKKPTTEATSSRKVIRKEYASSGSVRAPESARATMIVEPSKKSMPKKAGEKKSRKKIIHVVGRQTSMYEDPAEAEAEEEEEPAPKAPPKKKKKKLLVDAMTSQAPSKSKPAAPKKSTTLKPKRFSRDIPAATKNKTSTFREAEDEERSVLMKLRPHLPEHNASHPVAEDMKKRKDSGLGE